MLDKCGFADARFAPNQDALPGVLGGLVEKVIQSCEILFAFKQFRTQQDSLQ
jgi:hypothetical protein